LAGLDERQATILEMRVFGGMTVEETAVALHISEPTVKRDARIAKAWLMRELGI
jgi:DNA-directed RNA polymerase specialized sigma24 family protein